MGVARECDPLPPLPSSPIFGTLLQGTDALAARVQGRAHRGSRSSRVRRATEGKGVRIVHAAAANRFLFVVATRSLPPREWSESRSSH